MFVPFKGTARIFLIPPGWLGSALVVALPLVTLGLQADAGTLSQKECSVLYQRAKRAGTLGAQRWEEFRQSTCGAPVDRVPEAIQNPFATGETSTPSIGHKSKHLPAPASQPTGTPLFPSTLDPRYSDRSAGEARRLTCLDQYRTNRLAGANGGLAWTQKGGGYYSECAKRLRD